MVQTFAKLAEMSNAELEGMASRNADIQTGRARNQGETDDRVLARIHTEAYANRLNDLLKERDLRRNGPPPQE